MVPRSERIDVNEIRSITNFGALIDWIQDMYLDKELRIYRGVCDSALLLIPKLGRVTDDYEYSAEAEAEALALFESISLPFLEQEIVDE